ncbi:MAG: acyltransferase [Verrucomicrobiota bacterium]|nr:acyltransferase [Verrucomicrobiota bacterium]
MPLPVRNIRPRVATFEHAFDPANNAFGFLRLALALLVIVSHSFHLGGFGADPVEQLTDGRQTIGLLSVSLFFVLSGFLIFRSASRTPSVGKFLFHRFLRIFPGYWVCLIVCACVFAPIFAYAEHGTFLSIFAASRDSAQSYVSGNWGLFHPSGRNFVQVVGIHPQTIAGLLHRNPQPLLINGSIWTLSFETTCYAAVALLALVGALRLRLVVLGLFVGLWALSTFNFVDPIRYEHWFPVVGLEMLITLSMFFFAGGACFLYRDFIRSSKAVFATCVALSAVSLYLGWFALVGPICLSYAFLRLGFHLPFGRLDQHGDFSYGAYIYAFPIQQGLALLRVQDGGFGLYLTWSLLLTAIAAILSYRFVEEPCLRWKKLKFSRGGLIATDENLLQAVHRRDLDRIGGTT